MNIKDTVVIKKGDWEVGVCARLGGNAIFFRHCGKDVFRPLEDEAQLAADPYLQGSPILLPANRIYRGKFSFEGVEYSLPITEPRTNSHLHGTVHRQPFAIVSQSDTSVTLKFSNTGAVYPFDFDMTVTYSVDDEGFSQKYEIVNTGSGNMPYTFCLHSTFVEPESFSLPISKRQEHDAIDIPTGRYLDLTEQERRYLTGSPSKGLEIVGYYESAGNVARIGDVLYEVSDNFDYWIMYNGRGESGFLCVEPQAGKVNGLNIEDGYKLLSPGQGVVYTTRYSSAQVK